MLDRYISIVLIGVSGACLWSAMELAGGAGGMRGAALPLGLSIALGLLSLALLVSTFRMAPAAAGRTAAPAIPAERRRQSLTFLGLFILYVAITKPLGFLVGSFLTGTLMLSLVFRMTWWKALLIAVVMSLLSWFLFKQVLDVPLPSGTWLKGVIQL